MFPVSTKPRAARTAVKYDVQWSGAIETAAQRAEQRPGPRVTGRGPHGAAADVVAAAIREGGAWSIAALAEQTGFSKRQAYAAVYALEKKAVLTRRGTPPGGIMLWSWNGSS